MRNLLLLAFAFGVLFGGTAHAQERALAFQAVVHTTAAHSLPIPGRTGHRVGVAAFRGLAIVEGDEVASHQYSGSFDFVEGSGRIQGYASWTFEDGSRIEAAYDGEAKATPNGGATFTATYSNVVGSGRYAGMRGEGTFFGRRIQILKEGSDTYFRGTLKLRAGK